MYCKDISSGKGEEKNLSHTQKNSILSDAKQHKLKQPNEPNLS